MPYAAHYAASKHGLLGLMRSLAAEFAKTNLTVNAVCPGYVDTPMTDQSVARVSRDHRPQRGAVARRDHQHECQRPAGRIPTAIGDDDPDPVPAAIAATSTAPRSPSTGARAHELRSRRPSTPKHFLWDFADGVATITLNRPERKNPLTFESYDELRDDLPGARPDARRSRPSSSPARAAISARAATSTRSSAR